MGASSPMYNGFLRFTSGATPADLLVAMHSFVLAHAQALVGLESRVKCVTASQCVTRQTDALPNELCQLPDSPTGPVYTKHQLQRCDTL